MGIGLSFGKNKQKINTTTNNMGHETIDQNQSSNSLTTDATRTVNNSATSSVTDESSRTSSTTTGTSNQQTSQTGQSQSRLFSDAILGSLEDTVGGLLNANRQDTRYNSGFSVENFVNGITSAAAARASGATEEGINTARSMAGGRDNTMGALLASRLANDNAANLAGIEANARGQAEEIARQNFMAGLQGQSMNDQLLSTLAGVLRGGVTTEQQATTGNQAGTTSQVQDATTQALQQMLGQQSQTSDVLRTVSEIVSQLLRGSKDSTETSTTKGTTTKSGGGIGLSL